VSALAVGSVAVAISVVAGIAAAALGSAAAPSGPARHPDLAALRDAGWSRGLARWEAIRASIVVAGVAFALLLGLPLAFSLFTVLIPSIWIRLRAEAARERARRSVGPLVRTAESALRSGTSLPEGIRRALEAIDDPLTRRPFASALRSFELGAGLDSALVDAARSCGDGRTADVLMTLALGVEERLPRERAADLLASIADRVAFDDALADEIRARAAGARQQQWLLAAVVPALALYLAATMPMLSTTLASDLGRFVLLPSAAILEVAGVVLSRRVIATAIP
jgi:Flp pilus assembly protein TadB